MKNKLGCHWKEKLIKPYETFYCQNTEQFYRGGYYPARAIKANVHDLSICIPMINNKRITKSTTLKELMKARNITFRIRKLTPRECFRLMDLKEKDIDKLMDGEISNSQLYKLAGNSICISPMKECFRQMFFPDENHYQKPTDIQPEFDFGDDE